MKTLRYGKLMIMTDQDQDGSHIKGLIINFIHHNWPGLLKMDFLEEFITPIIKATRKHGRNNDEVLSFFSIPEFEEWKNNTPNWNRFTIKYYKGLGTSTSEEAKEYFSNMTRHRIKFLHKNNDDDSHITMAFSKKMVEARKDWLTNWMTETKRRKELGLGEEYLYGKDTKTVTYKDFINKELVLFSNMDNERSIPSMMDGLKPGSRKVLFTCIKRNLTKELKVAQLAGSVAELSAYHHGEQSLMSTIINLAQNYVGSNNINLLQPNGQFGTRLQGGKDAASPRYIFTKLSPLTRLIFHPHDDPLLNYLRDDNLKIEPEWYLPIIPMVLVNGAEGIGTGWMTKIPNHNPREIIENLQRMIRGDDPIPMKPWYKNFRGEIDKLGETRFVTSGEVGIVSEEKLEITELPVGTWTQAYKENVLDPYLNPGEKEKGDKADKGDKTAKADKAVKATPLITDYKEYNTDITVKFQVFMTREKLKKAELEGLHKVFKLQSTMSTTSMCAFDRYGVLRRYDSATQILREFFDARLEYYTKRKVYLEGMLEAEAAKLTSQARFILEKCDGDLRIENRKKKEMIAELVRRGYPGDPVRSWKIRVDREAALEEEAPPTTEGEETADEGVEDDPNKDFDYLLGMKLWSLTLEKKNELLKKRDEKRTELEQLKKKVPSDLWQTDLDALLAQMDEIEEEEREAALSSKPVKGMKGVKDKKTKKIMAAADSLPSPHAIRVIPKVDTELIKKYEKADQVKIQGKKPRKVKDEPEGSEDQSEKTEKSEKSEKPAKVPKEKKPKKEPGAKTSPKKKTAKKRSTESDISLSDDSGSEEEFKTSTISSETPKRTTSRRAATKPKQYSFGSDEEEDFSDHESLFVNDAVQEHEPELIEGSDDDFGMGTSKKNEAVRSQLDSSIDDAIERIKSDSEDEPVAKKKPAATKKPAPGGFGDSTDEDAPKKKTARKPAAKTRKITSFSDDDDDEFKIDNDSDSDFGSDFGSKKKKPAKAPAKRKAAEKAPKQAKAPKKLPVTKSKPASKKKLDDSSDDEFATNNKRKASSSDSDGDLFKKQTEDNLTSDEIFEMVRDQPSKPAPASKKNEYSFEPSVETYDSDEEYQPETKTKGAKAPPKKRQVKKKPKYVDSDESDF